MKDKDFREPTINIPNLEHGSININPEISKQKDSFFRVQRQNRSGQKLEGVSESSWNVECLAPIF